MADREKVIKGLECCIPMTERNGVGNCCNCPYDRKITLEGGVTECCHDLMTAALALLKVQEPVKPRIEETILSQKYNENLLKNYYCGNCGEFLHKVIRIDKFCSQCGRAVKWE